MKLTGLPLEVMYIKRKIIEPNGFVSLKDSTECVTHRFRLTKQDNYFLVEFNVI